MRKYCLIGLIICLIGNAYADDAEIANCSGSTCVVKVFRNDAPDLLNQHNISLNPPMPIDNSDIVNINVDGSVTAVPCNGSWQNLLSVSGSPELQNRIKCTVETNRTSITADIRLFDQSSFQKTYQTEPYLSGFTNLNGTSDINPYCVNQTSPENAEACQWEEQQNNESWVIVSRTEAYAMLIGAIEGDPGNNGGGTPTNGSVCADQVGNWGQCVIIDNNVDKMCLVDAVECTSTTSDPICNDNGTLNNNTAQCEKPPESITCLNSFYTYNAQIDRCERPPYCADGGVFNTTNNRCEIIVSNQCPPDYSYNENLDSCTKIPSCLGAGVYNQAEDACVSQVISECPNGFLMNGNICERSPVCSATGLTYHSGLDRCIDDAILTCPSGYSVQGNTCVRNPTCPSGGTYNSVTNRCENNPCQIGSCTEKLPLTPVGYQSLTAPSIQRWNCETWNGIVLFNSWYRAYEFFANSPISSVDQFNSYNWANLGTITGLSQSNINAWNSGSSVGCVINNTCEPVARTCGFPNQKTIRRYYILKQKYTCSTNNIDYNTVQDCNNSCSACSDCPNGYLKTGDLCIANPSCSDGGIFNAATDRCEITTTPTCPPGSVYDSGLLYCVETPNCGSGSLNTATDLCEIVPTNTCPSNYSLDGQICKSPAICNIGSYNSSLGLCQLSVADLCPNGYTYDSLNNVCTQNYTCFNNSVFSDSRNMCELEAIHTCSGNYQYNSANQICSAIPICQAGAFDPQTLKCYEGENTCPYGSQYPCRSYQGKNMCSALNCAEVAGNETATDTTTGADDKKDDAPIDANGVCQGNIYFFNGKDNRCRSWGVSLVGSGCCNKDTYLMGTIDCEEDEKILSKQKKNGLCHYVGEYDSKHIDLGFTEVTTEKKKTYCCFNSKLARIIHEQGRPQLIDFSQEGWGTPKNPVCRGFSPEEFQMLDFQKIDLKEWSADITTKSNESINTGIKDNIDGKNGNFDPLN